MLFWKCAFGEPWNNRSIRSGEGMVTNQNVVLFYRIRVPVGPWCPRKICLSSKMMNYQPQHIRKREIVDIQKIKYKYKSKNNPWAIQLNQKLLWYKNTCYSWTDLNTINSKIFWRGRDLLGVQFKYLFSFFLGLSVTIPSVRGTGSLHFTLGNFVLPCILCLFGFSAVSFYHLLVWSCVPA